jgi:drug/metabolite transporter (DMT)-like permease
VPRPRPLPVLIGVCFTWGTIPAIVAPVHLPAEAITATRVWLASLALAAVLVLRPSALGERPADDGTSTRRIVLIALGAGTLLALHWTLQFAAYQRAPAPTVSFVIFLSPIGMAALAPWVLGEPTPLRTVGALAVGVVGAALVTGPSARGTTTIGVLLAAASAAGLVGLNLLAKPLAQLIGGARAALAQFGVAALVLSPVMFRLVAGSYGAPRAAWVWLVLLGLVHTALFVSLYLWALARIPVATVGVIGQLEPVGVTVVAALQGHPPAATTLAGGALILVAGGLVASRLSSGPTTTHPLLEASHAPR